MPESVDPADYQAIFDAHRAEFDTWLAIAAEVKRILEEVTRAVRVPARVEARAKETGSLLGKVDRTGRRDIRTFRDLAGARVIVPFASDVDTIVKVLQADERVLIEEIDRRVPDPQSLEYRGVHVDLVLRNLPETVEPSVVTHPLYCEVQIKTFAQSLWAELSHLVTYKRDVSPDVERRVRRLLALCEIVDDEIETAMTVVRAEANLTVSVAETLERWYYGLTGRVYSRTSSAALLDELVPAIAEEEMDSYVETLNRFVTDYSDALRVILTDQPEARGIPLLTRPEALFIFERLTNRPKQFEVFWGDRFRADVLARLKKVWGDPLA